MADKTHIVQFDLPVVARPLGKGKKMEYSLPEDFTGRKSSGTIYRFVNTTVAEEQMIHEKLWCPIVFVLNHEPERFTKKQTAAIVKAFEVWFKRGYFLREDYFNVLNEAAASIGEPKVQLVFDGTYDQPVFAKKNKPNNDSWRLNGEAREIEFDQVYQEYEAWALGRSIRRPRFTFQ